MPGRAGRHRLESPRPPAARTDRAGTAVAVLVLVSGEVVAATAAWLAADVAATDHTVLAGVVLVAVLAVAVAWPAGWAWWHRRTVTVTVLPPAGRAQVRDR